SGEMVRKLKAPPAKTIHALAFSPNGKTLAAGGNDYAVSIWDVVSGELQKKLEFGNGVRCLLYSRDGKRLYAGGSKDRVHSWDTTTWQEGPAFNYKYTVHAIALTPDDKTLAAAGRDLNVKLYEAATGKLQATWDKINEDVILGLA